MWELIQNQILGMKWLKALIGILLQGCGIDTTSRTGGSIQFFLYDVINLNYSWEYKTVGNLIRTASGCPYPRLYCRKP